jgi:hypothetical protein
MWDVKDVPCGLYAGGVNFTIGGTAKRQETASRVGDLLRIFLQLKNDQIVKTHAKIPWDDNDNSNETLEK